MKLVLLGTAGYHPSDQRQTACLMLPEQGIVLDAGTGMYRAAEYLVTERLDIFLTHSHLDHIVGLTYLFDVVRGRKVAPIKIHGATEKLSAIRAHLFSELIFPVIPPCQFEPFAGPVALDGGGQLEYFPLQHPGGTLGFRLEWPGHSLAYVTDTTARSDAAYVERLRGVDLLVHECNFSDDDAAFAEQTGHSWTSAVAQVAKKAGVGRLVLVHFNPLATEADPIGLSTARAIFPKTDLGHDRMTVEF
jgi:ribonuclease Z